MLCYMLYYMLCYMLTIHSMCMTKGPLVTCMLHIRVYGDTTYEDIKTMTITVGTQQVFINLLEIFLKPVMGHRCVCTIDFAYMGTLLAQVAIVA